MEFIWAKVLVLNQIHEKIVYIIFYFDSETKHDWIQNFVVQLFSARERPLVASGAGRTSS